MSNPLISINEVLTASEYEFNQVKMTPQEKGEFQSWPDWAHGYADTMKLTNQNQVLTFDQKWMDYSLDAL